MTPLASLFMLLNSRQRQYRSDLDPRIELPTLQDRQTYMNRPPMPFRDPMQGGPEPPVDPKILAALFRK